MGSLGYSPQSFFVLEPKECIDIIEASRKRFQFEHELQYIAMLNAIGPMYIKNYKYRDIFKDNKAKKEVTEEEKEEIYKQIADIFIRMAQKDFEKNNK